MVYGGGDKRGLLLFPLLFMVPALRAESATEPAAILTAKDTRRIALVVLTPRGAVAKPVISQLLELTSSALRPVTNLEPVEVPETQELLSCGGRLGCIAPLASVELNRVQPTASKDTGSPTLVLLISVLTQLGSPDRLTILLLDASEVEALKREHPQAQSDELEGLIFDSGKAVLARPPPALSQGETQARAYLERVVDQSFKDVFERFGFWDPYGTIELSSNVGDAAVMLDGQTIGIAPRGLTRIVQVAAGTRALRLEKAGAAPFEAQIEVRSHQTLRVDAEIEEPGDLGKLAGTVTFWSGLALVAGGVAISAYGLAASPPNTTVCMEVGGGAQCDSRAEFLRFGFAGEGDIQSPFTEDPNGSGPMILPLGYSLAIGGGTMAAGSWLLSERPEWWWVPTVAGVALGAAAYGLSAALDGSDGLPVGP